MNVSALPYHVRPLESRDLATVISIDRMVFKDPWPESVYTQEIYFNPHARYFVLCLPPEAGLRPRALRRQQGEHILGFVGMRMEGLNAHISTLAVRPAWQGQGLGELLLHRVLRQAVDEGAETVTLEVRVSNTVARNLYAKYAFVESKRLRRYYQDGEDAFLMRAHVDSAAFQALLHRNHAALVQRIRDRLGKG